MREFLQLDLLPGIVSAAEQNIDPDTGREKVLCGSYRRNHLPGPACGLDRCPVAGSDVNGITSFEILPAEVVFAGGSEPGAECGDGSLTAVVEVNEGPALRLLTRGRANRDPEFFEFAGDPVSKPVIADCGEEETIAVEFRDLDGRDSAATRRKIQVFPGLDDLPGQGQPFHSSELGPLDVANHRDSCCALVRRLHAPILPRDHGATVPAAFPEEAPGYLRSVKLVVTGASGNIGSSILEAASGHDEIEQIVGIARRRPAWEPPKTSWIEADILDDDLERIFSGSDAVVAKRAGQSEAAELASGGASNRRQTGERIAETWGRLGGV